MPSAILSARHDAGGELFLVSLDVGADVARAYTTPGQYVVTNFDPGGLPPSSTVCTHPL